MSMASVADVADFRSTKTVRSLSKTAEDARNTIDEQLTGLYRNSGDAGLRCIKYGYKRRPEHRTKLNNGCIAKDSEGNAEEGSGTVFMNIKGPSHASRRNDEMRKHPRCGNRGQQNHQREQSNAIRAWGTGSVITEHASLRNGTTAMRSGSRISRSVHHADVEVQRHRTMNHSIETLEVTSIPRRWAACRR